jgi:hypothetical protein
MFEPGDIVRYFYLWARQADAGEESGRKARPACVIVKTPATAGALFLIPITSQPPEPARAWIAIPEIECRRGGLASPSRVIVDEYNRVELGQDYDFESQAPIGRFGSAFMRRIAEEIKATAAERRLRGVIRK